MWKQFKEKITPLTQTTQLKLQEFTKNLTNEINKQTINQTLFIDQTQRKLEEIQRKTADYSKEIAKEYSEKAKKVSQTVTDEINRGKEYTKSVSQEYQQKVSKITLEMKENTKEFIEKGKENAKKTVKEKIFSLGNSAKSCYESGKKQSFQYLNETYKRVFPTINPGNIVKYSVWREYWRRFNAYMYGKWTEKWMNWNGKYRLRVGKYVLAGVFVYAVGSAVPGAVLRYQLERDRNSSLPPAKVTILQRDISTQTDTQGYFTPTVDY